MQRLPALVFVLFAALPARALACATCNAGDPTLTLAGTEQPFADRVRLSIAAATSESASRTDHTTDRRLTLGVAWAPAHWLVLSATAPLVLRDVTHATREREGAVMPGDLELRARFVVLRDRLLGPTHLVTLAIGSSFPLASTLRDAQGAPLSDEAQTARASIAPLLGIAWSYFAAPLSLQTFATAWIPIRADGDTRSAVELRAGTLAFVQLALPFSLVAGLEARALGSAQGTDGSGAALWVTAGLLIGAGDLAPYLLARIPVAQGFADGHVESASFEIGAALDV